MKDQILALQAALAARHKETPTTHGLFQLMKFADLLTLEDETQSELRRLAECKAAEAAMAKANA